MRKKKKEKKRKEKRNDMLMYGISFHWAFMPPFEVHLLGIFVIVGFCEFFMSFSLLEPLLLCIWSVEGSCESSMRSYAVWIMIDIY